MHYFLIHFRIFYYESFLGCATVLHFCVKSLESCSLFLQRPDIWLVYQIDNAEFCTNISLFSTSTVLKNQLQINIIQNLIASLEEEDTELEDLGINSPKMKSNQNQISLILHYAVLTIWLKSSSVGNSLVTTLVSAMSRMMGGRICVDWSSVGSRWSSRDTNIGGRWGGGTGLIRPGVVREPGAEPQVLAGGGVGTVNIAPSSSSAVSTATIALNIKRKVQ